MFLKSTKILKGTKEPENPLKNQVLMCKIEIFFLGNASVEGEKLRDVWGSWGTGGLGTKPPKPGAGKGKAGDGELKSSIPITPQQLHGDRKCKANKCKARIVRNVDASTSLSSADAELQLISGTSGTKLGFTLLFHAFPLLSSYKKTKKNPFPAVGLDKARLRVMKFLQQISQESWMCSLKAFCRFGLRRVWSSPAGKVRGKSKHHINNPEIKIFYSPLFKSLE